MCGIAGILRFDGRSVDSGEIAILTEALAHRGRDCTAQLIGGKHPNALSGYSGIALGHRRLSVIDLSIQAAQPMVSSSRRSSIVYNGELYNYRELRDELKALGYRFRTDSDTEVVLTAYEAWGEGCLQHFNGMFAFAVWDDETRSLFCARDPVGIKPFYYTLDTTGFSFASESQALARKSKPLIDRRAATCFFLSMYVPREFSIYEGIHKLLPGQAMRIGCDGRSHAYKYWSIASIPARNLTSREAVKDLTDILDRAVKAQLQSDVPVGVLLSGGFDSGMIVASAARCGIPLHTYSIGFDDNRQASELPVACAMAERYGTKHHERIISGSEVMPMVDRAIACLSEPVADSAIVPTFCLSGMAASDGVKVLLSGTGGDEVFAGYSRYVASSWRRRVLFGLPDKVRKMLSVTPPLTHSVFGARLRHRSIDMMVYSGGAPGLARLLFGNDCEFRTFLDDLAEKHFPASGQMRESLYEDMAFDLQVYLPDLLLLLLDQLTMAHTVEGRVPLLDLELIAAAYSLPSNLHSVQTSPVTRRLMREIAVGRVDERTFSSRKLGFSGPVESWIEANRSVFRETILASAELPVVGELPLEKLWKAGCHKPTKPWAMEMFSIYCFSRWCQSHV